MREDGHHVQKASEVLLGAVRNAEGTTITIGQITRSIGDRAFGLILLLFSLPNCVPAPPGLGSIMGLPLALFGIQLALGRRYPWLPGFLARRRFQRETLLRLVERGQPYINRVERICRPRMTYLTGSRGERVYGIIITILAAAILIPLFGARPNLRETVTLVSAGVLFDLVVILGDKVLRGDLPSLPGLQVLPGLEIRFAIEPLGMIFALVASTLWIVNSIYSIGYMRGNNEPRQTPFYICFAVAIFATLGIAFSANLFTLFLFYEVLTSCPDGHIRTRA